MEVVEGLVVAQGSTGGQARRDVCDKGSEVLVSGCRPGVEELVRMSNLSLYCNSVGI